MRGDIWVETWMIQSQACGALIEEHPRQRNHRLNGLRGEGTCHSQEKKEGCSMGAMKKSGGGSKI